MTNAAQQMEWVACPRATNPGGLALFLAVAGMTTYGIATWTQTWLFPLFSVIVLVLSCSSYLFSTRYQLLSDGICYTHLGWTRSKPWTAFRRMVVTDDSVFLSPFTSPQWVERYRGLVVWLSPGDNTAILGNMREKLSLHSGPSQNDVGNNDSGNTRVDKDVRNNGLPCRDGQGFYV